MTDTAIRVDNLGKRYVLGRGQGPGRYRTLRDTLADAARTPWRRLRSRISAREPAAEDEFWALRDVSFEIKRGEVVGIIGRNGAGKSTLLKILSRITEPTTGSITLRGRVASLLEVGTGFHPELTGRENIYLNGAILGMHRSEIRAKFDEIVAFAEIDRFLDTPVKRYSSGMYVRLAFAVAAHLEPEILIVDEVLAVGDVEFQQKCLGKMQEVSRGEGRTVLFVSHNLGAVRSLCSTGILMRGGRLMRRAAASEVVGEYLASNDARGAFIEWAPECAPRADYIRFVKIYVTDDHGAEILEVETIQPFVLCFEYEVLIDTPNLRIGFFMQNGEGIVVCGSNDSAISTGRTVKRGMHTTRCGFPGHFFNAGTFFFGVGADAPGYDKKAIVTEVCLLIRVVDHGGHGPLREPLPGIVRPSVAWKNDHDGR